MNVNGDENNFSPIDHDNTKSLDVNSFNEFKKTIKKDLELLGELRDDVTKKMEVIASSIKSKASEEDLRNLEEIFFGKLEEFKINSNRKFADKTETVKNIKYLDAQIKYIIDTYIRRMEKGDNWLIANKKNFNQFTCASCESNIGEVKDSNDQYVPWNKYPARENDKNYRV